MDCRSIVIFRAGAMRLPPIILLVLLTAFTAADRAWSAVPVKIGSGVETINMAPLAKGYFDAESRLTFEDVAKDDEGLFNEPWGRESFSLGYVEGVLWIKISLQSELKKPETFYIEQLVPWIHDHNLYVSTGGEPYRKTQYGAGYPFSDRHIATPGFFMPVTLEPGKRTDIILRIHSIGSVTATLFLHSGLAMRDRIVVIQTLIGLVIGGLVIIGFFNLFLFISVRDRNYLNYVIYLAAMYLLCGTLLGFNYQMLWPNSPWLNMAMNAATIALANLGIYLFATGFLNTRTSFPKTHNLLSVLAVLAAIGLLLCFTGIYYKFVIGFLNGIGTLFMMVVLYVVYKGWQNRLPGAQYFLMAWIISIVAILYTSLSVLSLLDFSKSSLVSLPMGVMIEMTLLSFALGAKINADRLEKELAQKEALESQTELAHVLEKSKHELELKVEERTAELKEAKEKAEYMARTDALTGLDNRRSFYERGEKAFAVSKRYGHNLSIIMVDLDHFKNINDTHGHSAGDEALKLSARAILETARETDIIGRLGGEEFALIMLEAGTSEAFKLADRLRVAISEIKFRFENTLIPITASLGVAQLEGEDKTMDIVLSRADLALYKSKSEGRNRVTAG